ALHDRHERAGTLGPRLWQAVELLDLREADVHLRPACLAPRTHQLGQAVQGLRPEHQVHVRGPLHDRGALLGSHAAADADQHRAPVLLERLPAAELAEDLFLRFFAYRAGIDQDHVGFFGVLGQFEAVRRRQHVRHAGRVVLVHLAPVGLDEQLSAARGAAGDVLRDGKPGQLGHGTGRSIEVKRKETAKGWHTSRFRKHVRRIQWGHLCSPDETPDTPAMILRAHVAMLVLAGALGAAAAVPAHAGTIYRCDAADGSRAYVSSPVKGARCVSVGNYAKAAPSPPPPAPAPAVASSAKPAA